MTDWKSGFPLISLCKYVLSVYCTFSFINNSTSCFLDEQQVLSFSNVMCICISVDFFSWESFFAVDCHHAFCNIMPSVTSFVSKSYLSLSQILLVWFPNPLAAGSQIGTLSQALDCHVRHWHLQSSIHQAQQATSYWVPPQPNQIKQPALDLAKSLSPYSKLVNKERWYIVRSLYQMTMYNCTQ